MTPDLLCHGAAGGMKCGLESICLEGIVFIQHVLLLDLQLVFTEVLQNATVNVLYTVDIKQSYKATMFVNATQETSA